MNHHPDTPAPIRAALDHVRLHHPTVCQVMFTRDGCWLFMEDGGACPAFGREINIDLLCEALNAATEAKGLPCAFAYEPEEA